MSNIFYNYRYIMKIAILNDTHCGIRNSSDIFMDYQEKFYRDVFFPYLLENDMDAFVPLPVAAVQKLRPSP